MNTEPQTEWWRRLPRPICGRLSLWALAAAAAVVVLPVSMAVSLEFLGVIAVIRIGSFITGLYAGGIMSIASFVIGLIGLIRRESPRWPAVTGFLLSVIPAFGGICLLCRAPW